MPAESGAKGGGDGDRSEEQSVDLKESDSSDEVQCTRRYVCVYVCVCGGGGACVCVSILWVENDCGTFLVVQIVWWTD